MSPHRKISLKVIAAPATGPVVSAPPVLKASDHLRKLRRRFAACRGRSSPQSGDPLH